MSVAYKHYEIGPGLFLETAEDRCYLKYCPDDQHITILFKEEIGNLIKILHFVKHHNEEAKQERIDQEKLTLWDNYEQRS